MKIRRPLAFLLAFAMLISLMVAPVSAVEITEDSFELKADAVVTVDGTVDQTVNVVLSAKEAMSIIACEGTFSTKETEDSSYICLTDYISPVDLKGMNYFYVNNGAVVYRDGDLEGYEVAKNGNVMTAVYTVDKDTPAGKYTVKFSAVNLQEYDFNNVEMVTYSAIIEVKAPAAPASDYEIYYELDSEVDDLDANGAEGTDNFMEYDVNSNVTATVYMKNNTGASVTMQAYDIYLDYSEKLIYESHALEGAVAYAADKEEAFNKENGDKVVDHIQLIKGTKTIALESGEAVELGTIVFSFADGAAFDEELAITLVDAADASNSAKAEDVTNFSVGGTDEGDATSYYPVDVSEFEGVEVNTKHTVTFETDEGTAVDAQTVGHNLTATEPEDPTKANHTFVGWYADEELTTEFVFDTAKITDDTTVYAKWEQDTVTVTWYDANGDELTTTTVNKGEKAEYPGEDPTKTKDGYTYTFLGWNTDPDADTALNNLTVTENTEFYPIFSESINKYTVTWKNGETVLESDKDDTAVEYNGNPTYNANEPTMTGDAQYSYEFKGWTTVVNPAFGAETIENIGEYKVTGDTVFYAVFDQITNQYEVTYSDEGTTSTSGKVDYNNTTTLPEAKGKTGYTFAGWYSGETRVGGAGDTYTVIGDIALTAKYTANEYTVKFDANGGSGTSMDDMHFTYDVAQNLTQNTYTKDNANFAGWNTKADGTGVNYSDGASVKNLTTEANGTVTLYAQWTNLYTVTLDGYTADEGEVTATPAIGAQGTEITLNAVAKEGYEFVGYTAMDASGNPVTVTDGKFKMPASNVTVTATFEKSDLTVKVDSVENGDVTIENGETDVTEKDDAHVGDTVTLNVVPNPGYKVESVTYVKSDDDNADAQEATPGENNTYTFPMPGYGVTVEVKFAAISYTIDFNGNGATTGSMASITGVKFDADQKLPKNAFTKDGYTFAGWSYNGATYADEETVKNLTTEDGAIVTLDAQWTEATYTITLNTNEGVYADGYNAPATYIFGAGATLPTADNITKTGHDFAGWYADANFTGDPVTSISATTYGNKEFWAKWTPATYTITYDSNGGSEIADGSYTYGVGLTQLPEPTRGGYDFGGWYDGDTKVESISATDIGDKELTAQWTPVQYTITFDANNGVLIGEAAPNYDITDNITLPTVTRTNYTFAGWKVTKAEGNWTVGDEYSKEATEIPAGKYGNVTLTAQWDIGFTYSVESYTYAKTGYKMLRIATDGNANAYKFGEEIMYYTDNADYKLDGKAVFATLIPINDGETVLVTDDNKLTDAAMEMITQTNGAATVIARDGDVNGDEVVNIADANVVYQMVQNGGSYYGNLGNESQSDILSRLEADMHTETKDNDFRGTLDDVDVIVNDINGTN